ncbi:MAG: DUF3341 domain-containing protein [Saprospiraceae bacterium]|nr:DUF3341 domain-containing protein [Saprospiraceae bacterium]
MENKVKHTEVIYGLYNDEEDLLRAVKSAKQDHLEIYDVYSPFPVHGLDPILGLEESRLHQAGFIYGALGTLTAFLGMTWIFTKDWPIIFGGKPYWSVPAFIPITFELTVLFAAIGMTVTFYIVNGLGPGVVNNHLDDRITDDKFCIAFDKSQVSSEKAQSFFKSTGASEVNSKTI